MGSALVLQAAIGHKLYLVDLQDCELASSAARHMAVNACVNSFQTMGGSTEEQKETATDDDDIKLAQMHGNGALQKIAVFAQHTRGMLREGSQERETLKTELRESPHCIHLCLLYAKRMHSDAARDPSHREDFKDAADKILKVATNFGNELRRTLTELQDDKTNPLKHQWVIETLLSQYQNKKDKQMKMISEEGSNKNLPRKGKHHGDAESGTNTTETLEDAWILDYVSQYQHHGDAKSGTNTTATLKDAVTLKALDTLHVSWILDYAQTMDGSSLRFLCEHWHAQQKASTKATPWPFAVHAEPVSAREISDHAEAIRPRELVPLCAYLVAVSRNPQIGFQSPTLRHYFDITVYFVFVATFTHALHLGAYQSDLFPATTIYAWLWCFATLLQEIVDLFQDPRAYLQDIWNLLDLCSPLLVGAGMFFHGSALQLHSLAAVSLWLKMLEVLLHSHSLGPLIPVIINMTGVLIQFCVLSAVVALAWSAGLYALLHDGAVQGYSSFSASFVTLLKVYIGQFDLDDEGFAQSKYGTTAQVLLGIYGVLVMVLLLNLLIAVLGQYAASPDDMEKNFLALTRTKITMQMRDVVLEHKLPPPLNLLQIPEWIRRNGTVERQTAWLCWKLLAMPVIFAMDAMVGCLTLVTVGLQVKRLKMWTEWTNKDVDKYLPWWFEQVTCGCTGKEKRPEKRPWLLRGLCSRLYRDNCTAARDNLTAALLGCALVVIMPPIYVIGSTLQLPWILGVSLVDDEDVSQGHNAEQGRSHDDHQIEGKDIDQRWDKLIDTAVSTAFEDRSHDERLGQIEEKVDKYMKREQKVDKYIELEQKVDNLTKMLEYLVSAQQDRR